MEEPHILLASPNLRRLQRNLAGILDDQGNAAIELEIREHIAGLFRLGEGHFRFAESLGRRRDWRQRVSRLYYAAFSFSRAVRLDAGGTYSTDVADHKSIGTLPQGLPNVATYSVQLPLLRTDRNLSDYNHMEGIDALISSPTDSLELVGCFRKDVDDYLTQRGIALSD